MSEAERRREAAKGRAQRSRDAAKLKAAVDASIVNALASLISHDGRIDACFAWRDILTLARDELDQEGYGRLRAVELLRARFDPTHSAPH